ncbi:MAG: branched-chain amino acid ABC transporter permease, partial [Gammaproteobacteria bacterium]|nr:branched-chain amino acid ABC transporter permease [Gammaproteobacteria bacterium]
MFYREAGQFKTTYATDQAIFTIRQDYWFVIGLLVFAFVVPPLTGSQYLMGPILTQFLVFGLAALGLNLLTGYAGQISLGTGGFMAVGAYSCYNLVLRLPEIPPVLSFLIAGVIAALVGIVFGLPSLRIKGFYLAVTTLASQFFLLWLFDHVGWFTNYDPAGVASAPQSTLFGRLAEAGGPLDFLAPINVVVSGPHATPEVKYVVTLAVVVVLTLLAKNLVRSATGRAWMAIRDMDIAAEI